MLNACALVTNIKVKLLDLSMCPNCSKETKVCVFLTPVRFYESSCFRGQKKRHDAHKQTNNRITILICIQFSAQMVHFIDL